MPRTSPPRKDKNKVPREKRALPPAPAKEAERVAKVIARAGLASRREIEEWILAGRVAVNGTVLESPALTVTAQDVITVDGAPLPERERTRLYLYHKPKGVVTTNKDPEGRTTLFEILPKGLPRLVSVGRLDLNSEGLLLLTNDGGLARVLELPETGWLRRYRVRANGQIDQAKLDTLLQGINVGGVEYGPIEAVLDRVQGANAWITVALREGKNREVRNVLGALGLQVNRLIRTSYGPFQLGEIAEGGIEEVRTRVLRDQIGADLARASGADFTGPLVEHEMDEEEEPPARRLAAARSAASRSVAKAEPARKAPTARGGRGASAASPAEADDFSGAAARRPRRRIQEEHELESRGTVADRRGRTVKVERVVASRASETNPARDDRAPRDGRGRPGRAAEGRPSGAGRGGPRGSAPGRSGHREREGADFGAFEERPRGERFGRKTGERSGRPSGSRTGAPARAGGDEGRRGRAPRPYPDDHAGTEDNRRSRAPRAAGAQGEAPRSPSRAARSDEVRSASERAPRRRPAPDAEGRPFRPRAERGEGRDRPAGGRFGRGGGQDGRPESGYAERSGRPAGSKGRPRPHSGGEGAGAGRGRSFGGEEGRPSRPGGFSKGGAGKGGLGKGRLGGSAEGKASGRPPRGGAPGGKRPSGPRSSGPRPSGPRPGGSRGKR